MRYIVLMAVLALTASTAAAQKTPGLFISKPIDTSGAIVATDNIAAATSGATRSTLGTITRTIGSAIENNGYVKTINNLFGKRAKPIAPQAGLSPIPQPGTYQMNGNAFKPAMPIAGIVGQTPGIISPQSPTPHR